MSTRITSSWLLLAVLLLAIACHDGNAVESKAQPLAEAALVCKLEAGKGPYSSFTLEQKKAADGTPILISLTGTWKKGPLLDAVQSDDFKPIVEGETDKVVLSAASDLPQAFRGTAGEVADKHEDQTVDVTLTASEDDSGLAVFVQGSSVGPIEHSFYRCKK